MNKAWETLGLFRWTLIRGVCRFLLLMRRFSLNMRVIEHGRCKLVWRNENEFKSFRTASQSPRYRTEAESKVSLGDTAEFSISPATDAVTGTSSFRALGTNEEVRPGGTTRGVWRKVAGDGYEQHQHAGGTWNLLPPFLFPAAEPTRFEYCQKYGSRKFLESSPRDARRG